MARIHLIPVLIVSVLIGCSTATPPPATISLGLGHPGSRDLYVLWKEYQNETNANPKYTGRVLDFDSGTVQEVAGAVCYLTVPAGGKPRIEARMASADEAAKLVVGSEPLMRGRCLGLIDGQLAFEECTMVVLRK